MAESLWLPTDCTTNYSMFVSLQTSGRSAVFYAAEEGDLELVKLLIQRGANLSLKDKVWTEAQPHSQTV